MGTAQPSLAQSSLDRLSGGARRAGGVHEYQPSLRACQMCVFGPYSGSPRRCRNWSRKNHATALHCSHRLREPFAFALAFAFAFVFPFPFPFAFAFPFAFVFAFLPLLFREVFNPACSSSSGPHRSLALRRVPQVLLPMWHAAFHSTVTAPVAHVRS